MHPDPDFRTSSTIPTLRPFPRTPDHLNSHRTLQQSLPTLPVPRPHLSGHQIRVRTPALHILFLETHPPPHRRGTDAGLFAILEGIGMGGR